VNTESSPRSRDQLENLLDNYQSLPWLEKVKPTGLGLATTRAWPKPQVSRTRALAKEPHIEVALDRAPKDPITEALTACLPGKKLPSLAPRPSKEDPCC